MMKNINILVFAILTSFFFYFSDYFFNHDETQIQTESSLIPVDQIQSANSSVDQAQDQLFDIGNFVFSFSSKTGKLNGLLIKTFHETEKSKDPVNLLFTKQDEGLSLNYGVIVHNNTNNYEPVFDKIVFNKEKNSISVKFSNSDIVVDEKYQVSDDYQINKKITLTNLSSMPISYSLFTQFQNVNNAYILKDSGVDMFRGVSFYNDEILYKKIPLKNIAKNKDNSLSTVSDSSWFSYSERYFLNAIKINYPGKFYTKYLASSKTAIAGHISVPFTLAALTSQTHVNDIYSGPEEISRLDAFAPKLSLVVDYGIFWPVAKACLTGLKFFYQYIPNWGVSIILVTLVIKILFLGFNAASIRNMNRISKLQPEVEKIKERCGDDKIQFSMQVSELYKKNGMSAFTPLSGCLIGLMQVPFFIAFYAVLRESIELRHAPFFGWITDLSYKDPYYLLPILMGLTMYVQQKMSPPPSDETQAMVFEFFPLILTIAFMNLPSGLVIYWTANSLFSILQMLYVNRIHKKTF